MSEENARPPLPNQQGRRRRSSSSTKSHSWRHEDRDTSPRALEKGIDASSFHSTNKHARARPSKVNQALKEASSNVVKQKRREVTTSLKLQRAAFKEVSSLKTWPLQEMAINDYNHWMKIHHGTNDEKKDDNTQQDQNVAENHGDSTGLSSSSLDEPKRIRRQQDDDLSPRKSSMRHQFQQEFLKEQALQKGDSPDLFQQALWCMEPRIFSVEKSSTGKRKYMVGALGRFLDYYWRKVDPKHRHYYELIRERTPCRLYFDLEFSKAANPDITEEDSVELLQEFIAELSFEFERIYDIDVHQSCIVDLDSSTDKKFSHHLIVHLPNNALFADTTAAGRFVRVLVGRLAEEAATGQLDESRPVLARHLFVHTKPKSQSTRDSTESADSIASTPDSVSLSPSDKGTTCFVDMGVYTRNRLFRLLGSSKYGKPACAALRISESNTFPFPQGFSNDSFYVPDMEARVKEKRDVLWDDAEDLDMEAEVKKFLSAVDWTNHATALGETLVVPVNATKMDFPILHESEEAKALIVDSPASSSCDGHGAAPRTQIVSSSLQQGHSPFPSVDDFIVNEVGCRGGVQGSIRAWSVEKNAQGLPQFITYQMSRNRFCERLGRPHRSNNIMWTVDLQKMQCTQACHDPDCRAMRFRGTPVDLPEEVREDVADALFEQQLATMDEKELIGNKQEASTSFDEAEFERALLGLNINGDELVKKKGANDGLQDEPSKDQKPSSDGKNCSTKSPEHVAVNDLEPLSDEALMAAMVSNPELFP